MYEINAFVANFLKYLDDLAQDEKKAEEEKEPEISEEEQLRLAVIEIQKLLNAAGCNAGIADGIWGRRTQAAAVLFAKTAKLPTNKSELLSQDFLKRLRVSPANFCPKPTPKAKPNIKYTAGNKPFYNLYSLSCDGEYLGLMKFQQFNGDTYVFINEKTPNLYFTDIKNGMTKVKMGSGRSSNAVIEITPSGKIRTIRFSTSLGSCYSTAV